MANQAASPIDPNSGFCVATSTFHSKRAPVALPSSDPLDVTTFLSSCQHSGTTALIDAATGRRVSFTELWRSVAAVSYSLATHHHVRHGDVVLLLSPNSLNFPVVALAVMSIGAVVTTTNPLNTPAEISKQAADSNPVLAFTTRNLAAKLAGLNLPIILLEDQQGDHKRGTTSIAEMLTANPPPHWRQNRPPVRQSDTATLLYSSGTTGTSKGVVSTHRNLISMAQIIRTRLKLESGEPETFICTVPMFHVYGLAVLATGLLGSGSTIVILSRFDMGEMIDSLSSYGVTYLPLVPPILVAMANTGRKLPLARLKRVWCGGAPLSKEVIEGFREKYPAVEILQGYGLTESTGIGTSTDSAEESQQYGSAGLLAPNTEARIVDTESGAALPVNKTGELWIRGPYVMKGYFNNQEATSSTLLKDGWLRTGDLCYIDDEGYLFVVDRLKELIKYKGYQVAPAELEALLLTHHEIADAAVIPFPDKEVGQFPMAYIVRKRGSELSESSVIEFVGRQVAQYKRVRRVAFVSTIPKNQSGKILRKDLIKLATGKLSSL